MLAAAILLTLASSSVVAHELDCPAALPPSAVAVTQPPPRWTGLVPTAVLLNDAGVSTGALEDRATLLGEHRQRPRGLFTVTFSSLRGWQERDRWLMCKYGAGNEVILARRLAPAVDQCTVTFTPDRFGGKTITVACR